jgi:glycosidase
MKLTKSISLAALVSLVSLLVACGGANKATEAPGGKHHPEWSLDDVVYELNTRQFTREGTFAAATTHLDRLKELGVDLIWVMPIYPIGVEGRKGELGSYYAISDYKGVNPEFGTMDDFKGFVKEVHSRGMKIILDWVANHTSPDALWSQNKEWYRRDSLGNFVVMYDWTDIAPLDYSNRDMRAAMIDAMSFWVRETGIDGFRCDVAHEIPADFWNEATAALETIRPDIFMLAEAEKPELQERAFDAYYGWELHSRLNGVFTGTQNADSIRRFQARHDERFKQGFPMLFTSNHDENSWSGTEFERMGDAAPILAALTYVLPGMPLIYNGQEVGFNRRLEFFVKDSIDWTEAGGFTALYRSLNRLRHTNRALWSNGAGGSTRWLDDGARPEVLSIVRETGNNVVVALFNLSPKRVDVSVADKVFNGEFVEFSPVAPDGRGPRVTLAATSTIELGPWGYKIYSR